jgi:adenylate cyclase
VSAADRAPVDLLVAFADLSQFASVTRRLGDRAADVLDGYYEIVGERLVAAGGRVVKFIGDAALVVFPEARADEAVNALLDLKAEVDGWFSAQGLDCRLTVKAHVGRVVAGPYGARGDKRFDVIGEAVNVAATLEARGFAISPQAFRRLAPATRRLFKKHTPPITYIPVEARRP